MADEIFVELLRPTSTGRNCRLSDPQVAAQNDNAEMVKALLEAGADRSTEMTKDLQLRRWPRRPEISTLRKCWFATTRRLRNHYISGSLANGAAEKCERRIPVPMITAQPNSSTRRTLACSTGSPSRIRTRPKAALAAQSPK